MLVALSIRDIVLIDKLDLGFATGLTVFTGETGAGKSIVLDSLSLALGSRGSGSLTRKGAEFGTVTASFDFPVAHPVYGALKHHGFDADSDGLILRRQQFANGKTRSFINDRPVSTAFLREIGASLVEIHGQHDDRALLDPASHRALLDQFGSLGADMAVVSRLWQEWQACEKSARELADALASALRETAYLESAYKELNEAAPQEGEEETLAARRQALQGAAKMRGDLEAAFEALSAPAFPFNKLNVVLRRFERVQDMPTEIKALAGALERVLIEANEAQALAEGQLSRTSEDNLDTIEERLFKLRGLARKYRVPVADLASLKVDFETRLSAIETGEADLADARKRVKAAAVAYMSVAKALSAKRAAAGAKLDKAVEKELPPLKLEKAKFFTHTQSLNADEQFEKGGPSGLETIMFYVQTNPGSTPGPLMKVASGGELARFLLALKVVLAAKNTAPVLVFDEIDTGMGGATASAIGERLSRLGHRAQVLAVTHSPQVAAAADHHYRLYKASRGSGEQISVQTSAESLDQKGRREEIARMLAGKRVTDEARAAADSLIGARHDSA